MISLLQLFNFFSTSEPTKEPEIIEISSDEEENADFDNVENISQNHGEPIVISSDNEDNAGEESKENRRKLNRNFVYCQTRRKYIKS